MRRRPPVFLLLLALTLAACNGSRPSGPSGATPEPSPSRDYTKVGPAEPVGTGFLAGVTPDGSAAYVAEPDPAFPQPGCEGRPESVLHRLRVDGSGRELLGDGTTPIKGLVVRGPGGRIAFVDQCEEFFQSLQIGKESSDGEITELRELRPEAGENGMFATFSFSWTPDGASLLAAVNDVNQPDGNPAKVVKIDPATGAVSDLFQGEMGTGIFQVAQLEDGTYVVAADRLVTFRDGDGKIDERFPGNGFELFPDRTKVAIYGEALSVAGEGGVQATVVPRRPDYEISSASVAPDGRAIVFGRYSLQGSEGETLIASLPDGQSTAVPGGTGSGPALFTGDGGFVLVDKFEGESAQVLRVPIGG